MTRWLPIALAALLLPTAALAQEGDAEARDPAPTATAEPTSVEEPGEPTRPDPRPEPAAPREVPATDTRERTAAEAPRGEAPEEAETTTEAGDLPLGDLGADGAPLDLDGGIVTLEDAGVDAGPPDAGPPDAGPPDAGPSTRRESDEGDAWTSVLEELLFDRREAAREAAAARRAAERRAAAARSDEPSVIVNNTPTLPARDIGVRIVGCDAAPGLLGLDFPERRVSTFGLLLLLGLALLAILAIDRARQPLPERGLLPRLLSVSHLALRLAAVVMVLMIASRLLPTWLRPALILSIAAVAVAVGFGAAWMLLPDVVGGAVLYTERRLRPGQWVRGEGFEGRVRQIGPRLTLLEDRDGVTVSVPNRQLVKSRLRVSDRRWHEVEVTLSVVSNRGAADVRSAIEDSVLSSPHVPSDPHLVLARDPSRPDRWTVRARLIDPRFAQEFEGQLLERVEEALRASAWAHPDTDEVEV